MRQWSVLVLAVTAFAPLVLSACGELSPVGTCTASQLAPAHVEVVVCADLDPAWAATAGFPDDGDVGPYTWAFDAEVVELLPSAPASSCGDAFTHRAVDRVVWLAVQDDAGRTGHLALGLPSDAAVPAVGDVLHVAGSGSGLTWGPGFDEQLVTRAGDLLAYDAGTWVGEPRTGAAGLHVREGERVCRASDECGSWEVLSAWVGYDGSAEVEIVPGTKTELGPLGVALTRYARMTSGATHCNDWNPTTWGLVAYRRAPG
ncbi:MAG: hypothetical protein HY908_04285 [Myxococcales bacterium]|nr:hypothetical protein [Myxococcales bacterium]